MLDEAGRKDILDANINFWTLLSVETHDAKQKTWTLKSVYVADAKSVEKISTHFFSMLLESVEDLFLDAFLRLKMV